MGALANSGRLLAGEICAERKEPARGHNGTGSGKDHLLWSASQVVASGSSRAQIASPLRRIVSASGR